jgi:hypothetical protein
VFSQYAVEQMAAGTGLPDPLYLAGFETAPNALGVGGVEPTEDGYGRLEVSWAAAANKEIPSDAEVTWTAEEDWPELVAGGLYDAPTGGNLWLHDVFDEPFTLGQGDSISFPAGDVVQRYR